MHRLHSIFALAATLVLALAPAALAGVMVFAACEGDVVTCRVGIYGSDDDDWQGVVLQWRYFNVCDDAWRPVDMEPLPPSPWAIHTVTFAAHDPDERVEYQAFTIDSAGDLHLAPGTNWPSSDEVTCADPVLSRGYLVQGESWPEIEIWPCPDTCWFGNVGIFTDELEPGTWEMYVDAQVAVDVYGYYRDDEMPGGSGIYLTAIEPVESGEDCDPAVGTVTATWGTVKSLYR